MPDPAGSVRLLLPSPGAAAIVLPTWNGNEFRNEDGSRPVIRTVTPRYHRPGDDEIDGDEMDVDVVIHGDTPLSTWATAAGEGAPVALSGPGRGYEIDDQAAGFLLAGDESALPAMAQLMEEIPAAIPLTVIVEVADPSARVALPDRSDVEVTWLDLPAGSPPGAAMVEAVNGTDIADDVHIWVAGEAAAVQALRRHLLQERSIPRSRAVIRGYWKHGRDGAGS